MRTARFATERPRWLAFPNPSSPALIDLRRIAEVTIKLLVFGSSSGTITPRHCHEPDPATATFLTNSARSQARGTRVPALVEDILPEQRNLALGLMRPSTFAPSRSPHTKARGQALAAAFLLSGSSPARESRRTRRGACARI